MGESKSFYGYESTSTLLSLLIQILPASCHRKENKPLEPMFPEEDKESVFSFIIRIISQGLRDVYGFNIEEVFISIDLSPFYCDIFQEQKDIEEEAQEIFKELGKEGSNALKRIINDLKAENVKKQDIIILVDDALQVLNNPKMEALPEVYLMISVIVHWLTKYSCKRLIQVLAPEGLAVYHRSIPASLSKYYMDYQEHFSLKELLGRCAKEMTAK